MLVTTSAGRARISHRKFLRLTKRAESNGALADSATGGTLPSLVAMVLREMPARTAPRALGRVAAPAALMALERLASEQCLRRRFRRVIRRAPRHSPTLRALVAASLRRNAALSRSRRTSMSAAFMALVATSPRRNRALVRLLRNGGASVQPAPDERVEMAGQHEWGALRRRAFRNIRGPRG